jgi:hypothetical protein
MLVWILLSVGSIGDSAAETFTVAVCPTTDREMETASSFREPLPRPQPLLLRILRLQLLSQHRILAERWSLERIRFHLLKPYG